MAAEFMIIASVITFAVIVVVVFGMWSWEANMRALRDQMMQGHSGGPKGRIEYCSDSLPPPVSRYLQKVLAPNQRYIRQANIKQSGTFNLGLGTGEGQKDNWKPFTAKQVVTTHPPGFLWDARIYIFPWIAATVCDAYIAREGILIGKLLGLFKLLETRGTPDVSEGELMRFLAEAPWYPTALMPHGRLRWEPGENNREATAVLADGNTEIRALFRFDESDLVENVEMDRLRLVEDNLSVRTRWVGRYMVYQERDGMLIPQCGEVSWILPEGPRPYWRGSVLKTTYQYFD